VAVAQLVELWLVVPVVAGSSPVRHLSLALQAGFSRFSHGRPEVWCNINIFRPEASCGTEPEPPTHSATLYPGGRVEICSVEKLEIQEQGPPPGCFQNWPLPEEKIPTLHYGETTASDGIGCTSASDGITCIKESGAGWARTSGSTRKKRWRWKHEHAFVKVCIGCCVHPGHRAGPCDSFRR
jgi:hypothetical protein